MKLTNKGRVKYRLALIIAMMLICSSVFLLFVLGDGRRLALGPGIPSRDGVAKGVSSAAKELLKTSNFEASKKVIMDLEAEIENPRLVTTLQAVTEEHQICVDTFKEGHRFLPGVKDGPLIPTGYGDAGVFSKYTRSSTEAPHRAKRGDPQTRTVIYVEAHSLGYFSRAASLVQPGQTLEGFK
jgi:hypothetical protein